MNTVNSSDIAVRSRRAGLVDVLDRVLDKGVVVDGDVYLCVAGIDLVYLKLKLLLASSATVEKFSSRQGDIEKNCYGGGCDGGCQCETEPLREEPARKTEIPESTSNLKARVLADDEPSPCFDKSSPGSIDIDPKKVEQGLAKLVLTLVELLRELMEKQALRRMELGTLTDKQIDQLGEAFMRLYEKMKELKDVFGLTDDDLNLDLGPLGELL